MAVFEMQDPLQRHQSPCRTTTMPERKRSLDDDASRLAQTIFETTLAALAEKRLAPADDDLGALFSAIYRAERNARPRQ
jgi:hypothetical protein